MGLFNVFQDAWDDREYECVMFCKNCQKERTHHAHHKNFEGYKYVLYTCKWCDVTTRENRY